MESDLYRLLAELNRLADVLAMEGRVLDAGAVLTARQAIRVLHTKLEPPVPPPPVKEAQPLHAVPAEPSATQESSGA